MRNALTTFRSKHSEPMLSLLFRQIKANPSDNLKITPPHKRINLNASLFPRTYFHNLSIIDLHHNHFLLVSHKQFLIRGHVFPSAPALSLPLGYQIAGQLATKIISSDEEDSVPPLRKDERLSPRLRL